MVRDRAAVVAVTIIGVVRNALRARKGEAEVRAVVAAVLREEFADIERQARNA